MNRRMCSNYMSSRSLIRGKAMGDVRNRSVGIEVVRWMVLLKRDGGWQVGRSDGVRSAGGPHL